MTKQITLSYYGVDGTGPTVTAAKNDAGRKIEAMLKGDYTPRLIQYRTFTMVLFRDPFRGWVSSLIENSFVTKRMSRILPLADGL